jgi:hypothetical protein
MDVYQKVLLKLYQATDGKNSQSVDLKDLVRSQGFLGNYNDIFKMLNEQGWIAETQKANYVRITHWGVKEVKKSGNNLPDSSQIVKREAIRLISETKQFLIMLEEFASDASGENILQLEKKLNEINMAIEKLKSSV